MKSKRSAADHVKSGFKPRTLEQEINNSSIVTNACMRFLKSRGLVRPFCTIPMKYRKVEK
jgi:hypothetical protein